MKTDFKREMKWDLVTIKEIIKEIKDKTRAVKIETKTNIYWIEKNKHAIQMLKKERKLLKKKLRYDVLGDTHY